MRGPRNERDDPDERKEHVLHTRVPESLDRHIKQRARNLGMSVSTVVRHVLLNTFGLVEDVVTDSTNVALSIAGQDAMPAADPARARRPAAGDQPAHPSEILGWQEVVLNLNAVCDRCNAVLSKGSQGAIAVRDRPGPRAILCPRCLGGVAGTQKRDRARPRRGG